MAKQTKDWSLFDDSKNPNPYGVDNKYPVVIKMKDNGVSIYHDNGVRESLIVNTKDAIVGFTKMKITDDRKAYDHFVKRALAVSLGLGTQEDWDNKLAEMNKYFEEFNECILEEEFKPKEEINEFTGKQTTEIDVPF